jgi:hypothetical protein
VHIAVGSLSARSGKSNADPDGQKVSAAARFRFSPG